MEISSQTCCRIVLFVMGFWRPKIIGYENYVQGQKMGAVSTHAIYSSQSLCGRLGHCCTPHCYSVWLRLVPPSQ